MSGPFHHLQLIGFLGKDPETRQVRGNGANFTVLFVATWQSSKASNGEWQARTEWHLADTLHKGDHVLVDGQLVSSNYARENGKSKKGKPARFAIFWSVRANSIVQLSRAEVPVHASAPVPAADDASF